MGANAALRRNSDINDPPVLVLALARTLSEYLPPAREPMIVPPPNAVEGKECRSDHEDLCVLVYQAKPHTAVQVQPPRNCSCTADSQKTMPQCTVNHNRSLKHSLTALYMHVGKAYRQAVLGSEKQTRGCHGQEVAGLSENLTYCGEGTKEPPLAAFCRFNVE